MPLTRLCALTEVTEDQPYQAIIDGQQPLAVFKSGDDIFVTQDKCLHAEASLSLEGHVENGKVICGWHDATFDLRSGAVISGPCTGALRTYPAIIRDGAVYIEL
jgi:nitrite reductase/ring-hydroxylating ferredoxin subunit